MPQAQEQNVEYDSLRFEWKTLEAPIYLEITERALKRWREDKRGFYGEGGTVVIEDQLIGFGGQKGSHFNFVAVEEFAGKREYSFKWSSQIMTTAQIAYSFKTLNDGSRQPDLSSVKASISIEQYYCE
jgi:hypothetical protein